MPQSLLFFALATLIWGTTWIVIEFQLGAVDPAVSVTYRFALAAVMLMAWVVVRRQRLLPPRATWGLVAFTGVSTFSLSYLLVYLATARLPSGLVAVAGSSLSLMNVLNSWLFLRQPVRPRVLAGGLVGISGVILIFLPEVRHSGIDGDAAIGLGLMVLSNLSSSLGSMAVQRIARMGAPLLPATAWAMAIGAGAMALVAVARGAVFMPPPSLVYGGALLYLALFGSVVAFLCYFALIVRIGADKAGYIAVMVPILALLISTVFEGYHWTAPTFLGLALAVAGNLLVLGAGRRAPAASGEAS